MDPKQTSSGSVPLSAVRSSAVWYDRRVWLKRRPVQRRGVYLLIGAGAESEQMWRIGVLLC